MSGEAGGVRVHPAFLSLVVALIVVLTATILLRATGVTIRVNSAAPATGVAQPQTAGSGKQLYYSTMHPWIVQDHPGTCPICGMELVPMPEQMQIDWERNHESA